MTQYARIWSLRSRQLKTAGDLVDVTLKSGKVKQVELGQYLFSQGEWHYYATPEKQEA